METLEKQLLKTLFFLLYFSFISQSLFSQHFQMSSHTQTGKIRIQMWSLLEQEPEYLQELAEKTEYSH